MAAIFGMVGVSRGLDLPALASRVQGRLAYRAPDGFSYWEGEGCLLAHGALHVGGVQRHISQPARLVDGRVLMIDGYLANYDELRSRLCVAADVSIEDTQLLALTIQRWGGDFVDHVLGEFAIALWDPRSRSLELLRDRLGGRPLYYARTRDLFAFGSDPLALATLPGLGSRFNPVGIATLWYDDAAYQQANYSVFEGVPALAPGHRLVWDAHRGESVRRYWRLHPPHSVPSLRSEREAVEAFQEVFGDAVARSMRGSRDTALMLSGGVDSAAILAARRGFRSGGVANDLLCISAVMDRRVRDEAALAEDRNILRMTAAHPRKLHFTVPVPDAGDGSVCAADLAEVSWSYPHPSDQSLLVPGLACRLARAQGCRLILNGVDGDNVTADGLYYMARLVREGRLLQAWRESRAAARFNTHLQGQHPLKLFLHATAQALEPIQAKRWRSRSRERRLLQHLEQHPVMASGLIERSGMAQRLQSAAARKAIGGSQQECDHLAWWLGNSLQGSESIVSRHGMEVRHPWCDLKVVELFQGLPLSYKSRNGWSKWVVRAACEEALGADVVWHSGKHHHGSFLNLQMLEHAAPYLRRLLDEQRPDLLDYVTANAISEAREVLDGNLHDPSRDRDRVRIIVGLAAWLKHVNALLEGV